jgi:capsular polysaccharide biosynthesis protein
VEPIRRGIEGFLRGRYGYEGDQAFRVLAVALVLVAVAVTSASLLQRPTYEASAQVLVDWQQDPWWENSGGSGEELQTLEYREPPTQTMLPAIDSRPVAEETLQRLGLQMDPADLLDKLTAEQIEGTQFVRLTYEDSNPYKAKRIVNTVGAVSSEFAERGNTLTATVWKKAAAPKTPVSPHPLRNGLLALVVGLMLCAALLAPIHRSA